MQSPRQFALVVMSAALMAAEAQAETINFTDDGSFSAPSYTEGDVAVTGSSSVVLLETQGIGVFGSLTVAIDPGETMTFSFVSQVTDVSIPTFVASDIDGNGLSPVATFEALDDAGSVLAATTTGFSAVAPIDVSSILGIDSLSRLNITMVSDGILVSTLAFDVAAPAGPEIFELNFSANTGPSGTGEILFDRATGIASYFRWDFGGGIEGQISPFGLAFETFGGTIGALVVEMIARIDVHPADCIDNACAQSLSVSGLAPGGARALELRSSPQGAATYEFFSFGSGTFADGTVSVAADANLPPTANAGDDQSARAGMIVLLDGSQSFDDNTLTEGLIASWRIIGSPPGSTTDLVGADTLSPTIFIDVTGTYEIELSVTDAGGLSDTDTVIISNYNLAPTADAGPDRVTFVGSTVTLDGTGSSDPEGDPISYDWLITAPSGVTQSLAGPAPSLTVLEAGVYSAELTVSDPLGPNPVTDTAAVTVATSEDFAQTAILDVGDIVTDLSIDEVTTQGNQNALTNFFSQAVRAIQRGDLDDAVAKLRQALLRTDGCVERGVPDGRGGPDEHDWILDCGDQANVYAELQNAIAALEAS